MNNAKLDQSINSLEVNLGNRSYPIYIGEHLIQQKQLFSPHIHGKQVYIVSNEVVAPLYLDTLLSTLSDHETETIILPDGEQFKTIETVNTIYTRLLELRANRSATLIALGGGVIGDITGFAASSYQRGVNFIQVPTTLLAQVDSSVGGKTGVNHQLGKNMIGAFYQPQVVIADTKTLDTLDDRQLSSGLAEVIKYGLIRDKPFADWLNSNIPAILRRDSKALAYAIKRSCENKAEVVAADELEKGQRALLNLGHTFGHAIETALNYGSWLHGEAVAAGTYMAALLSQQHGWLSQDELDYLEAQLILAKLPTRPPENISPQQFKDLMAVDKKVIDNKLRLVLLKSIGEAFTSTDFDKEKLNSLLNQIERIST